MFRLFQNQLEFDSLFKELKHYIFDMLGSSKDLLNISLVCKTWKEISNTKEIWNKFGVDSRSAFIQRIELNIKSSRLICHKKESSIGINIYFLGLPEDEKFNSSIIPNSRWFSQYGGQLTTYLDSIKVHGYNLGPWHQPTNAQDQANFREFNKAFSQRDSERIIALAYIANRDDIKQYRKLTNQIDSSVLLFVTQDEELSKSVANTISWKSEDDLCSFYIRVMEKVEKIANIAPLQNKINYHCHIS